MNLLAVLGAVVAISCSGLDPSTLIECDDHCRVFPASALSEATACKLRETSPGFRCVPDREIAGGGYKPAPCRSVLNLEGRCLATCIPAMTDISIFLARDSCWPGELCAPCWNPFTGAWSGACAIDGDKPMEPAPK